MKKYARCLLVVLLLFGLLSAVFAGGKQEKSAEGTGKLVLASDACERGSFLNTIATQVTQAAFDELDGPPVVVGSRNWITPTAEMEHAFFPQAEWIIDAIHERLHPLPGHRVSTLQGGGELLRRNRKGI